MTAKITTTQCIYRNIIWNLMFIPIILSIFLFSSCSTKVPIVPAMTQESTEERFVGKFVWYDLFADKLELAVPFYEELFGWSFANTESNRDRVKTIYRNGVPIGNAVQVDPLKKGERSSHWLGYISVENVDSSSLAVEKNKGSIHMEAKDLPERGRVAVIKDPQGAHVALVTSSHGDPPDNNERDNLWVGSELWTSSIYGALDFYTLLFDYDVEIIPMNDGAVYTVLVENDHYRAAIVKIPWEDEIKPQWIPYIAVQDITEILTKAESLGGTILTATDPGIQKNPNAIIGDPQGAVFGVVEIGKEQP